MKYRIAYLKDKDFKFVMDNPVNSEGLYETDNIDKAISDIKRWSLVTRTDYKLAQVSDDGDILIIKNLPIVTPYYEPLHPSKSKGLLTWLRS